MTISIVFEFKLGLPCKHVIEIPADSDIIPVKKNDASYKATKYNTSELYRFLVNRLITYWVVISILILCDTRCG